MVIFIDFLTIFLQNPTNKVGNFCLRCILWLFPANVST